MWDVGGPYLVRQAEYYGVFRKATYRQTSLILDPLSNRHPNPPIGNIVLRR